LGSEIFHFAGSAPLKAVVGGGGTTCSIGIFLMATSWLDRQNALVHYDLVFFGFS